MTATEELCTYSAIRCADMERGGSELQLNGVTTSTDRKRKPKKRPPTAGCLWDSPHTVIARSASVDFELFSARARNHANQTIQAPLGIMSRCASYVFTCCYLRVKE